MIRKQITYYGDYSEGKAVEWIFNLEKCFELKRVYLYVSQEKTGYFRKKVTVKVILK